MGYRPRGLVASEHLDEYCRREIKNTSGADVHTPPAHAALPPPKTLRRSARLDRGAAGCEALDVPARAAADTSKTVPNSRKRPALADLSNSPSQKKAGTPAINPAERSSRSCGTRILSSSRSFANFGRTSLSSRSPSVQTRAPRQSTTCSKRTIAGDGNGRGVFEQFSALPVDVCGERAHLPRVQGGADGGRPRARLYTGRC